MPELNSSLHKFSLGLLRKYLLSIMKLLLAAGIFYFIYEGVFQDNKKPEAWLRGLAEAFKTGEHVPVMLAFLLMPLNWGLEALKWQKLAVKLERLGFGQAYRSVLVGLTFGFITPNRLGDYAGRLLELQTKRRLEALGAIFLGRFLQLCLTVFAGSIGLLYFLFRFLKPNENLTIGFLLLALCLNLGLIFLLRYPQVYVAMLQAVPGLKRMVPYVQIVASYSSAEIISLLQVAALRYVVFVIQFMLLLQAFGINLDWWLLAIGVSSTFLLKSLVPSINALSDLGMRELSAMIFFSLLHQDKLQVMSASLSLWFINIALPSLVGLVMVWQLKTKIIVK